MSTTLTLSQETGIGAPTTRQGIIWLASYPKSGNTWFRFFLRALLNENETRGCEMGMASSREVFDDYTGICSSDLTNDEIDSLRPGVYEQVVADAEKLPIFAKTHDACTILADGEPMLSRKATAGAIYLIRNPLDVAVSFAYHSGHENFSRMPQVLADGHLCDHEDRMVKQLRQQMFGWSGHVQSWLDSDFPVHFMRYEDMKARPLETFAAAVRFAGLQCTDEEILTALEASAFEKLQANEAEYGFSEKMPRCKSFFRKGETGSWRESLSNCDVERIVDDHQEIMRKFDYLTDSNKIVF